MATRRALTRVSGGTGLFLAEVTDAQNQTGLRVIQLGSNGTVFETAQTSSGASTNVALSSNGGVASSPQGQANANYAPSYANDGSLAPGISTGQFWNCSTSYNGVYPQELDIAFNATYSINTIDVITTDNDVNPTSFDLTTLARGGYISNFTVDYQDASNVWHNVATVTGNKNYWRQFTFTAVSAKAMRIIVTLADTSNSGASTSNYARILEARAFTPSSLTYALPANNGAGVTYTALVKGAPLLITPVAGDTVVF